VANECVRETRGISNVHRVVLSIAGDAATRKVRQERRSKILAYCERPEKKPMGKIGQATGDTCCHERSTKPAGRLFDMT
jgi:hypothetical protein